MQRFRALDCLRGLVACAVALFHFGTLQQTTAHLAVDFFFVLSGFVLSHSYFSVCSLGAFQFARTRFARLYPLHLITTLIFIALGIAFHIPMDLRTIVLHLGLLQNIGFGPARLSLNVPSWSIAVEFWVNVSVYGALLLLGSTRSARAKQFLALVTAIAFAMIFHGTGHLYVNAYDYMGVLNSGLLRAFASFALGVLAYEYFANCKWQRTVHYVWPIELLVFFLVLAALLGGRSESHWEFLAPVLFAFAIVVFAGGGGWISHGLAKLSYLGEISFSIYLIHYLVIVVICGELRVPIGDVPAGIYQSAADNILFLAVVLAISHVSYKYIEFPMYRYFRSGRRRTLPHTAG